MRIACYALHYGKEYLAWSIRSIQDAVDEIHVFYTDQPSYGFLEAGVVCPDTEEELRREAERFCTKPLVWHRIHANTEGEHRTHMHRIAQRLGATIYLVVDSDEVWVPEGLRVTLDAVETANRAGRWLAHFANFWRNFEWMVSDGFRPIRVVDLRHPLSVDEYLDETNQPWPVMHFGYAQSLAIMRYKLTCHGHKKELRPNWLEQKFIAWKPGDSDTHPTANNLWTPHPTHPAIAAKVREVLHDHPYLDLKEIP